MASASRDALFMSLALFLLNRNVYAKIVREDAKTDDQLMTGFGVIVIFFF